jgi:hypothetical protein
MPITAKSRKNAPAIDRPFTPEVLARARHCADQYSVILWREEGRYLGSSVELPQCLGIGRTPDLCLRETRDVMVSAIATDLERGIEPPAPAAAHRRSEQVNIRLSPVERHRLEIAASAGGYHGISDYIRDSVLSGLSGRKSFEVV